MKTFEKTLENNRVLVSAIPIATFVLLTALASRVVVPLWFTPVPITMQVFAVVLSGLVLGSRKAAMAQLAFLTLIILGVPLTAMGLAGPAAFASPTAGYLLAFVPAAYVSGLIAERSRNQLNLVLAGIVSIAVIYIGGTAWLSVYLHDLNKAIRLGVVPFIAIDLIKAAIAVIISGVAIRCLAEEDR